MKHTKGEWSLPHMADETTPCNCGFVLTSGYCGAIATIHSSIDSQIENGDNPPIEEAVANAKLIHAAPDLLEAALDFITKVESGLAKSTDSYNKFKKAIEKATL